MHDVHDYVGYVNDAEVHRFVGQHRGLVFVRIEVQTLGASLFQLSELLRKIHHRFFVLACAVDSDSVFNDTAIPDCDRVLSRFVHGGRQRASPIGIGGNNALVRIRVLASPFVE